jgi:hypothetical protein
LIILLNREDEIDENFFETTCNLDLTNFFLEMDLNEKLKLLNLGDGRCEHYNECLGVGNIKINPKSRDKATFATHRKSAYCPWLWEQKEKIAAQNMKRLSKNLREKEFLQKEDKNGKLFIFIFGPVKRRIPQLAEAEETSWKEPKI